MKQKAWVNGERWEVPWHPLSLEELLGFVKPANTKKAWICILVVSLHWIGISAVNRDLFWVERAARIGAFNSPWGRSSSSLSQWILITTQFPTAANHLFVLAQIFSRLDKSHESSSQRSLATQWAHNFPHLYFFALKWVSVGFHSVFYFLLLSFFWKCSVILGFF